MKILKKPHERVWTFKIITLLKFNNLTSTNISKKLNKSQSVIYRQLKILESEKILIIINYKNNQYNNKYYKLTKKGKVLFNYFQDLKKFKRKWKKILNI